MADLLGSAAVESSCSLLAAKDECQLYDQNDHDHQLQHESARLLELINHHSVEILGGFELLGDQGLKVVHTDPCDAQFV